MNYCHQKNHIVEKSKKREWKSVLNRSQLEEFNNNFTNFEFQIVSYNLLSPTLLEENFYLYENLDRRNLDWQYRRENLMKEIRNINAHIYCFQEMEENEYKVFFKRNFLEMGFFSVYKKRNNNKVDGCCIALKKNFFEIEKQIDVDFFVPGVDILNRENVGIIVLLKLKTKLQYPILDIEPKFLCVATTHLLFNPKRGDTKIAQLQLLLANIDRVAFKTSKIIENKLRTEYHPIILCGDFNFSNNSKIYEFITKAKLENYSLLNRIGLSGQRLDLKDYFPIYENLIPERLGITDQSQFKPVIDSRNLRLLFNKNNENEEIKVISSFGSDTISHCFDFKSAYSHIDEKGDTEITTRVKDFCKSVDFIFFHSECVNSKLKVSNEKKNKLLLLERLELFNENDSKNLLIPNKIYSSDHFMIAAKFCLT